MKRAIKKVAVIGSGIMGSGIACHFANIGVEVILLDIIPRELNYLEKAKTSIRTTSFAQPEFIKSFDAIADYLYERHTVLR